MSRMLRLPHPVRVTFGPFLLAIFEAGRSDHGAVGSVHVSNGVPLFVQNLYLMQEDAQEAFVRRVLSLPDGPEAEEALRQALPVAAAKMEQELEAAEQGAQPEPEPNEEDGEAVSEAELIPLDQAAPPPFPTQALPAWLADWVREEARTTQTPEDLPGVLALSVLSAALGGAVRVVVTEDWAEPVNIYAVVALPPAERKSAVFSAATAPIIAWEALQNAGQAPKVAEAASTRRILEKRLGALEGEAAKAPFDKRRGVEEEAAQVRAELAALATPALVQRIADDSTPEAVGKLLAEQGGRLAVMSDEGGIFDLMAGRYSEGMPNFDVFTRAHTGTRQRTDRVHRTADHADHPALTMGLAVQPEVLVALRSIKGGMGRGLLARPLYSVPVSHVGQRDSTPERMHPGVRDAFLSHITTLLDVPLGTDEEGASAAHEVPLSPGARALHVRFQDWLEPQLGPEGGLRQLAGWGGKLCGQIARIAGLLHAADWVPAAHSDPTGYLRPIPEETVERALALGDYFLAHARIAFAVMRADAATELARHLLNIYRRTGPESQLSRRDLLTKAARSLFPRARDLDAPLALLVERGWLRQVSSPRTQAAGRPPAPTFVLTQQAVTLLFTGAEAPPSPNSAYCAAIVRNDPPHNSPEENGIVRIVRRDSRARDHAPTRAYAEGSAEYAQFQNGPENGEPPEKKPPGIVRTFDSAQSPHNSAQLALIARWTQWLEDCRGSLSLDDQWEEIRHSQQWGRASPMVHSATFAVFVACQTKVGEEHKE